MTEDRETIRTHGFDDHHHVRAKTGPIDRQHRADPHVIQGVWDIIQGKVSGSEPPLPPGHVRCEVPFEYVNAVAFFATRELRRRVCGSGFSVKVDPDKPLVSITWTRPAGLSTMSGNGYEMTTNCLAAHLSKLDPQHVGVGAAEMFLEKLQAAEAKHSN